MRRDKAAHIPPPFRARDPVTRRRNKPVQILLPHHPARKPLPRRRHTPRPHIKLCASSPLRGSEPQGLGLPKGEVRVWGLRGEGDFVVALVVLLGALAGGAAAGCGAVAGAKTGFPGVAAEVAELVAAAAATYFVLVFRSCGQ